MNQSRRKRRKYRAKHSAKQSNRIFSWQRVLLVVVGLIFGISLYQWNAAGLVGDQLPMPLGFGTSMVLTGSMEPTLSAMDLVFVVKADAVDVGDVVVYQEHGSLVIHRVIAVADDHLITQGDANNTPDAPVAKEAVKGVMLFHIPAVGAVVRTLQQPAVTIILLLAAFFFIQRSYNKEKETEADEIDALQAEIRSLMAELKDKEM